MVCPQVVVGGEGLQIWRGAVIYRMSSQGQLTSGGPAAWGLGMGPQPLTIRM